MKKEDAALKDKILKDGVKTILVLSACAILVIMLLMLLIISPALIMSYIAYTSPNPPAPEVEYAEFPIKIVYENRGNTFTIEDVYVCEYDGWDISEGGLDKYRVWNGTLTENKDSNRIALFSNSKITVGLSVGSASYYMGDKDDFYISAPRFYIIKYVEGHGNVYTSVSVDEISDYGIDIIECDLPEPIENRFEPNGFESIMPYVTLVAGVLTFKVIICGVIALAVLFNEKFKKKHKVISEE